MIAGRRAAAAGTKSIRRQVDPIITRSATLSTLHTRPAVESGRTRRRSSSLRGVEAPTAKSLPAYVLNCPETQVTTLPNGLRVASEVSARHFFRCWICLLDHCARLSLRFNKREPVAGVTRREFPGNWGRKVPTSRRRPNVWLPVDESRGNGIRWRVD